MEGDDDEEDDDDDDFEPNGTTKDHNDNDTHALSGGKSSSSKDETKIEHGKSTRRSWRVHSTLASRTASRTTKDVKRVIDGCCG